MTGTGDVVLLAGCLALTLGVVLLTVYRQWLGPVTLANCSVDVGNALGCFIGVDALRK